MRIHSGPSIKYNQKGGEVRRKQRNAVDGKMGCYARENKGERRGEGFRMLVREVGGSFMMVRDGPTIRDKAAKGTGSDEPWI